MGSRSMRWRCLTFLLLITVAGVQLLEDETAETSLRESGEQSLADVVLPLVKRETEKKMKKKSRKVSKKKRSRSAERKKKTIKKDAKKKTSRKVIKKKRKSMKNGARRKGKK